MPVHIYGCVAQDCRVCTAAISHIAGYYVFAPCAKVKCLLCKSALFDTKADPCSNLTLISFKDYYPNNTEKGLTVPSASLCRLLFLCEKVFWWYNIKLSKLDIDKKLLIDVLANMDESVIFPTLASHALETSDGIDNHYLTMVHLIMRKYLMLWAKKVLCDMHIKKCIGEDGSALRCSHIVQNV